MPQLANVGLARLPLPSTRSKRMSIHGRQDIAARLCECVILSCRGPSARRRVSVRVSAGYGREVAGLRVAGRRCPNRHTSSGS